MKTALILLSMAIWSGAAFASRYDGVAKGTGTSVPAGYVPPHWKDYAFTLPSQQGVSVTVAVKDGKVANLAVRPRAGVAGAVKLVFRPDVLEGVALDNPAVGTVERKPDRVVVTWNL